MEIEQIERVRPFVGVAHLETLQCPHHGCGAIATTVRLKEEYPWSRRLECNSCGSFWYVCTLCSKSRKIYIRDTQLAKHERQSHRKRKHQASSENNNEASVENEETMCNEGNTLEETATANEPPVPPTANELEIVHASENSVRFFKDELRGVGIKNLVSRAQFQIENVEDAFEQDDLIMVVSLCRLANEMSRLQRDRLAGCLDLVMKNAIRDMKRVSRPAHGLSLVPPRTDKQMRDMFMRGSRAIIPNLPKPSVVEVGEHAYVSVKECIQDLLGHGAEIEVLSEARRTLSASPVAQGILERGRASVGRDGLVLFLTEWSDDFEPNAINKSGRGSIWIKSITISSRRAGRHSIENTYPIAIGQAKIDHEEIEIEIQKELQELRAPGGCSFYVKGLGGMVPVHAEIIATLQDQPERRTANYIMGTGGNYSARWRYSINLKELHHCIPSCDACLDMLFEGFDSSGCNNCTNWNMDPGDEKLGLDPPSDYPRDVLPPDGKIHPVQLTYQKMTNAVLKSHTKMVAGDWTKENTRQYLMALGLSHKLIANVVGNAERCANWLFLQNNKDDYPDEYEMVETDVENNPHQYKRWKTPAMWDRGLELERTIDAIMHLVFLGIQKTEVETTTAFLKLHSKKDEFVRYADGVLEMVQKLHLPWCKCMPFGKGKQGGWVSENYLALARVSKWFYRPLVNMVMVEQPEDIVLDVREKSKWTKKICTKWLGIRGAKTSGKAQEVKDRVEELLMTEVPPILPVPQSTEIVQVHQALACVIAGIMDSDGSDESIAKLTIHIKIFLSLNDRLEKKLYPGKKVPGWISCPNFASLMNIPETMRRYGPLKELWEGGYQGEGFLQFVKPEASYGMRENWNVRLAERILENKALERLEDVLLGREKSPEQLAYRRYRTEVYAVADLSAGKAVSGIALRDGSVGVVLSGGKLLLLEEVEGPGKEMNGCWYGKWIVRRTDGNVVIVNHDQSEKTAAVILLPLLDDEGRQADADAGLFYLVDDQWKERNRNGDFVSPIVTKM